MMTTEKMTKDLFFVDLNTDQVEWIKYQRDAVFGGQFVHRVFNRDTLMQTLDQIEKKEKVFDVIRESCEPVISERGTEDFLDDWSYLTYEEPFFYGCTEDTADGLMNLYLAKDYIDEYCRREFNAKGDFSNLAAIPIGYTTITDAEYPLQAYANLEDLRIEVYLNDKLAKFYQFDSLWEMVNLEIPNLEFDELISISDWVVDKFDREYRIEDLAVRMSFFMKENAPYTYASILDIWETDSDMVRRLKEDMHHMDLIPNTLDDLQELAEGGTLSKEEEAKCYDIMTDLYRLYAEERYEPIKLRETEILADTLYVLGLKEYKLDVDKDGIHVVRGNEKLRGTDIYKHFADTLSGKEFRELREVNFCVYTDFKDLAAKNGVILGEKSSPTHKRGLSK